MLKACIEIIANGKYIWTTIPNENLGKEISDFAGDRDWECVLVTGPKKEDITIFPSNTLHKCDIFELNQMLLQANDFLYTLENLVILNLLLEDRNFNCDEVIELYEDSAFRAYNAEDMGTVAYEYLEHHEPEWYEKLKESNLLDYFDFESYGEEVLKESGTWLEDKKHKIIVEVFD